MKTFKLDKTGDVSITDNKIDMVSGIDLTVQTIRQVLGTNLGEWFGNENEGIDNSLILTKNPNYDLIKDTIETAIQYVADMLELELEISNFSFSVEGRTLNINFTLIQIGETTEEAEVDLDF